MACLKNHLAFVFIGSNTVHIQCKNENVDIYIYVYTFRFAITTDLNKYLDIFLHIHPYVGLCRPTLLKQIQN